MIFADAKAELEVRSPACVDGALGSHQHASAFDAERTGFFEN
jgi:hypothetical protein